MGKLFDIGKIIIIGEDYYEVLVSSELLTYASEEITVEIKRVNGKPLSYLHKSTFHLDKEERYIEAIQNTLEKFTEDKSIQTFLNWDGKLKYKISL